MKNRGSLYLSFIKHVASINSFKLQILCHICVDKDPNQGPICHYELITEMTITQASMQGFLV